MKKTGKYIYCVIKKPKSFDLTMRGIDEEKVYLVDSKKLAIAVSDALVEDYPITRKNTVTHQQVIEEVMRTHSPVLPISFGTVAENSRVLQEKMLITKENELLEALEGIEGKVELNLKALWLDMPKIFQKVVAENSELGRIKQAMAGKMLGRDEAIEIGKVVANAVESRRVRIMDEILNLLKDKDIITDYKETQLLGEQMIFNLAFLISENKQKTFDKIVRNLDEKYADENAYFKYIGPIPPFNFVNVPITLN
ncbi:MAG: GvpL/GvpF family gas vesicle protein [Parcubacteria group bacterium]|nr:GvpL/GvpF family gas vesicle protein [Parcubacteria group bacterium]